jgi:hypothetical protein
MNELLDLLKERGFKTQPIKKGVKVIPPSTMNIYSYIAHYGEKGYHPLRRYLKLVSNL